MERSALINKPRIAGPLYFFFRWPYMDWLGAPAAFLCSIHCFSLPFLTLLLPLNSLGFLYTPQDTWLMILPSIFMGIYSLLHGYLHHHAKLRVFVFFFIGFVLLFFDKLASGLHLHWSAASGAFCLAYAHFLNWRFSRSHNIACSCSLGKAK